jgi:plastocyanin
MYIARRPLAVLTLIALPLLAGCGGGSGSAGRAPTPTPPAHSPGCVPDPGDGRGGPYPSSVTSLCTGAKLVEVDVIADLKLGGGFSPSNITISAGTTVLFVWKSGGHNLHPFHDQIEDGGFTFRKTFSRPGAYAYDCQIHPGQNGIIHVI